jgi:hypothetical protein
MAAARRYALVVLFPRAEKYGRGISVQRHKKTVAFLKKYARITLLRREEAPRESPGLKTFVESLPSSGSRFS